MKQTRMKRETKMKKMMIFWMLNVVAFASSTVTISTVNPMLSSQPITIEADGIVMPKNKTILTAQASGIFHPFVYNNQSVKKGDKIAKITDSRRVHKLKLLEEKLTLQKTAIKSQTIKLHDAKDMYTTGVGSKNSYLTEKVYLEQLKESYQTLENEYTTLNLEEKNSNIYAPQDGYITNLLPKNAYLDYQTQLATLLTKQTSVQIFLDVSYAKHITTGMKVELNSGYADIKGVVSDILNKSSNNLLEVIVKPNEQMPLNLRVNATIILKNINAIELPKDSIVLVDNHPAVYVIKNNVAHLLLVEIEKDMIQRVLIKTPLATDAQIALKNAYLLHDGLEVTIK